MATIKSYTDINQSRKLAEILPLESADMWYEDAGLIIPRLGHIPKEHTNTEVPAWSLASLLGVLESEIDGEKGETYQLNIEKDGTWWNVWYREIFDDANPIETESTEELIDACYEMILKLHELNLL